MSTQPNRRGSPISRKLNSAKKSRRNRAPRSDKALGRIHYGLTLEQLESRLVLSGSPVLTAPTTAATYLEGDTTPSINFQFTDTLAAGGGSVGVDPLAYSAAALLNGAFTPTQNAYLNTDTFKLMDPVDAIMGNGNDVELAAYTPQFKSILAQPGFSAYDIAVFAFTNVNIPVGVTIKAIGSRPLALASTAAITVLGTIDVSAYNDPNTIAGDTPAAQQRLPWWIRPIRPRFARGGGARQRHHRQESIPAIRLPRTLPRSGRRRLRRPGRTRIQRRPHPYGPGQPRRRRLRRLGNRHPRR